MPAQAGQGCKPPLGTGGICGGIPVAIGPPAWLPALPPDPSLPAPPRSIPRHAAAACPLTAQSHQIKPAFNVAKLEPKLREASDCATDRESGKSTEVDMGRMSQSEVGASACESSSALPKHEWPSYAHMG